LNIIAVNVPPEKAGIGEGLRRGDEKCPDSARRLDDAIGVDPLRDQQ
jgi:hypothetical protein